MVLLNSVRALGLSMLSPHFPRAGCGPSQVGTERSAGVGEDTGLCSKLSNLCGFYLLSAQTVSSPKAGIFVCLVHSCTLSVWHIVDAVE